MKQSAKRLLSMILCLCMLLSLLPATAMAAGGTESGGTASGGSSTTPSVADAFGFKTDPPADFDAGDGVHPFSQSGTNDTINMVPVKEVGIMTSKREYAKQTIASTTADVYNFDSENLFSFSDDTQAFTETFESKYDDYSNRDANSQTFRIASGIAYDPTGSGRDDHVFYYGVDGRNWKVTPVESWYQKYRNYLLLQDFSYEDGEQGTVTWSRLRPENDTDGTGSQYEWTQYVDENNPDKHLSVTAGDFLGNGKETVVLYDQRSGNLTLRECTLGENGIETSLVYDLGNEITVLVRENGSVRGTLNQIFQNVVSTLGYTKGADYYPTVQLTAGDLDGDEKDELVVTISSPWIGGGYTELQCEGRPQILVLSKENDGEGNAVWRVKAERTARSETDEKNTGPLYFNPEVRINYASVVGDIDNDGTNEIVTASDQGCAVTGYSKGQLTSGNFGPYYHQALADGIGSVPSIGLFYPDGVNTKPYLFVSGNTYKYDKGYFSKIDEYSYSGSAYQLRQPIIGNFDGNTECKEQLLVAGYYIEDTTNEIGTPRPIFHAFTYQAGGSSTEWGPSTESGVASLGQLVLTAPDADTDDGMVMRYTGKEYVFSNPEVMAVLLASPYFEDLADDYENIGVTGFGTSNSTGSAYSNTVTNTVGAYVSFSQDISILGMVDVASVEFQTAYNYEWSKTNETSHTYETSISYEAGSGSNQVVMIATPVFLYHYDVLGLGGEPVATSDVSVSQAPCYTVISVEDYNASAELLGNPVIDSNCVTSVVPGQPQTYPSSKWQIDSYGGVTVPFDTPVLASQGNAVVTQEVDREYSQSLTQSYSHNIEVSGGAGAGGFVIGASYGYSKGCDSTVTTTTEVSRSGSVANVPAGNPDYSFKWQFATWDIRVGGYKVPVMGYIVSSVYQPPSVPQNLTATPGTDSVTLEWEPGYNSAVKYDIFRYYPEEKEDYQYDLIGTVDGTETEFVCEGLNPSTRYYFAVRAVGDKGLRSRHTEPVAVTTINPGQALPEIIIQPEDQYIDVSGTRETTFSTLANPTSHGVVNYAWERRDDSSSAWETISAGTYVAGYASRSLTLYDLTGSMDGTQYRCRVAERSAAPYPAVVYTRAATLSVGRAPTTTTLTSPTNLSHGIPGSEVKLTASVSANDKSACGGNLSFQITNTATGDVTTLMADEAASGNATVSWTPFTAGVYTIRAAYAGDGTTESSVSETVTYYVQKDDATPCYEITLSGDLVYGETITPALQSANNGQSTAASGATFKLYRHDGTEYRLDSPEWRYGTLIPGEYRVDAVLSDEVVAQKVFTVGKRPITITAPTISSIVEGTKFDLSSYAHEIQYPDKFEVEYQRLFALSGVTAEKPISGQYDISVVYGNPDDPELVGFLQRYQPTFEKSVFTVIPSDVADNLRTVAFSAGVNGSVRAYVSTTSTKELTVSPYGVSKGSTVFFSPEADEGFSVSRWTINGTEVTEEAIKAGAFSSLGSVRLSGTGLIVEALQSDINVNVEFTSLKYTVNFSGSGSGSVTAIQGSTELGSPVEVIGGSSITFTAVPAEGSVVKSWTITPANGTTKTKQNPDGSNYTGATLTLENINDNYTVDVEFEEAGTPLNVTCDVVNAEGDPTDGGLVTFTTEGLGDDGTALKGSTVKLTAIPKPGTAILRWEVYEGNTWVTKSAGTDEFTIYNLQADTSIRVVIRPNSDKYTVGYSMIGKNSEDASAGTITVKAGNRVISTGESCTAYASLTFTYEESEDYEFVGWNVTGTKGTEASNGTTHTYTISSLNQNTIVMATVQKKPKVTVDSSIENGSVSVTYQWNGETVTPANGYVYTGTVAAVTATPAEGYVVDTIKANGTAILTGDKTVGAKTADAYTINADTTLTATFESVATYTITFQTNGGTEITPITGAYGTAVTAPADPTKTGYTFDGWDKEIPETMPAENMTIKANWKINQYTITYETNGGTTVESITQDYGTAVTAPADPTRTGYTFNGWDKEIPETMPAEDVTITAQWTPLDGIKYTVKHYYEKLNGTYEVSVELKYGVTDTDTAAQAKDVTGFTAGSVTQQKIKGDGSTVIEIIYTRNNYTLTFKPENGGDDIVTTVKYGAAITAPADPEKTGYTFAGWDNEIPDTMPAEDVTIKATWTANQYAITVESAKNGSVSADSNNAFMDDTVTLTVVPEKGYTLETLTVTDDSGNDIPVENLGDGKYSFTMPASKVTVKATFMEDNSMLNFFVDVPVTAYYYDAVLWAAESGITVGTSDTTFRPNNPCTRAQVVTFLWRAAGSPDPESTTMPFIDVPKDIYYEKAVLWAVENGITSGTTADKFSPDVTCTRAQIVSFLWRFQGKPSAGTSNPFTDVAEGDYYTDAVLWAVENGITAGTSATTFRPNNPCTRAQTVTFLYRCLGK